MEGREKLIDFSSTGRVRPWKVFKLRNRVLSECYSELAGQDSRYFRKARLVGRCSGRLFFVGCGCGKKRLFKASFCRQRLCFICQWRRSLYLYHQIHDICGEILRRYPLHRFLFLTLTVKNVKGCFLRGEVSNLSSSWKRFLFQPAVRNAVLGAYRSMEISRSDERGDYHPHLHCILCVSHSYFDLRNYMSHKVWQHAWRVSACLDYNPSVDIRAVGGRDRSIPTIYDEMTGKAVAELAKYAVKISDSAIIPSVVKVLDESLFRQRLISFHGLFNSIRRDLAISTEEPSASDMITIGRKGQNCRCPVCDSELVQSVYSWRDDNEDYYKV